MVNAEKERNGKREKENKGNPLVFIVLIKNGLDAYACARHKRYTHVRPRDTKAVVQEVFVPNFCRGCNSPFR